MRNDKLDNLTIKEEFSKKGLELDFVLGSFPSTQKYAKTLNPQKDTVIISLSQTQGMGRQGRSFLSNEGGCYFSIIKNAEKDVLRDIPLMSVALSRVLEKYGCACQIKWPNDILIKGKKICGMLCDVSGGKSVLGVGINVYNDISPLADIATSLYAEEIYDVTRSRLIAQVIYEYYLLREEDFSIIRDEYQSRLSVMGKEIKLVWNSKAYQGKVKGITKEGFLIIDTSKGETIFMNGEVEIVK